MPIRSIGLLLPRLQGNGHSPAQPCWHSCASCRLVWALSLTPATKRSGPSSTGLSDRGWSGGKSRVMTALLIVHGLLAVLLIGAVTHQAIAGTLKRSEI